MRFIVLSLILLTFPAYGIEVTYSEQMCQALKTHQPRDDVTYQAGVDVDGNAVAPADIQDDNQFQLPETIKIPVTVDLAEEFNLGDYTDDELLAPVGILEVTKDGRVLQNGRDLTDRAYVICEELD